VSKIVLSAVSDSLDDSGNTSGMSAWLEVQHIQVSALPCSCSHAPQAVLIVALIPLLSLCQS
jgi:hypothetical protein